MRVVGKWFVVLAALAICLAAPADPRASAANPGLTLTPATVTLSLAAGSDTQTAEFTLTNTYTAPIALGFAFEASNNTLSSITDHLRVQRNDMTIEPGQSVRQTITLKDSAALPPGSQTANLIITQSGEQTTNVGVLPSVRMPIIVIKNDGAIARIAIAAFSVPRLGLSLPESIHTNIGNDGNMIAIPRGFITVTTPGGSVVGKGILNVGSQAISPGTNSTFQTPITQLKTPLWPGAYRASVSYGLGNGQAPTTTSAWFLYVAWWHIAALALLAGTCYWIIRILRLLRQKNNKKPPAQIIQTASPVHTKKPRLVGRDIL